MALLGAATYYKGIIMTMNASLNLLVAKYLYSPSGKSIEMFLTKLYNCRSSTHDRDIKKV